MWNNLCYKANGTQFSAIIYVSGTQERIKQVISYEIVSYGNLERGNNISRSLLQLPSI